MGNILTKYNQLLSKNKQMRTFQSISSQLQSYRNKNPNRIRGHGENINQLQPPLIYGEMLMNGNQTKKKTYEGRNLGERKLMGRET